MGNYSRLGGSDAGKRFAGKSQAAGYLKATKLLVAVSSTIAATAGDGGHDPPVLIPVVHPSRARVYPHGRAVSELSPLSS